MKKCIVVLAVLSLASGCYYAPAAGTPGTMPRSGYYMSPRGMTSYSESTDSSGRTSGTVIGPNGVSFYEYGP